MPDLVTIGETCAVFVARDVGRMRYCRDFTIRPGGAEATVAVGVRRLGISAGWVSALGDDELGQFVRGFIAAEEVDVSQIVVMPDRSTGIFIRERLPQGNARHYYYRNGSAFSALSKDKISAKYISSAKYLHVTGISPALSAVCDDMIWHAVEVAKDAGVTVCFDPNVRLNLWGKDRAAKSLEKFFRAADIVLPGLEDMEMLFGDATMEQACTRLIDIGCERFVLKNGHQNVLAYEHGQTLDFPVAGIANPVDVMGAGDAFAAGFIAGLAGGRSFADAVRYAITVAGISVQMPGNIESLPTSAEVERAMSGARKWNR